MNRFLDALRGYLLALGRVLAVAWKASIKWLSVPVNFCLALLGLVFVISFVSWAVGSGFRGGGLVFPRREGPATRRITGNPSQPRGGGSGRFDRLGNPPRSQESVSLSLFSAGSQAGNRHVSQGEALCRYIARSGSGRPEFAEIRNRGPGTQPENRIARHEASIADDRRPRTLCLRHCRRPCRRHKGRRRKGHKKSRKIIDKGLRQRILPYQIVDKWNRVQ